MLRFEAFGQGESLVLVHGLGGSARSWDLVANSLAQHRRLVLLNLPGHGGSPATVATSTFDGMVRSVEEFLDAEGLDAPDIVGSSLGGRVVLELARRVPSFSRGSRMQKQDRESDLSFSSPLDRTNGVFAGLRFARLQLNRAWLQPDHDTKRSAFARMYTGHRLS